MVLWSSIALYSDQLIKALGLFTHKFQWLKPCLALKLVYMDPTSHFPTLLRMQNYAGACAVEIA